MERSKLRMLLHCLGLLLAISGLPESAGAETRPLETQVKAAFLAKFAAYVTWPPSALGAADAPLVLCVLGYDPFGPNLEAAIAGQRVGSHALVLRRLDGTAGAATCHIAFLGGSARQNPATMLATIKGLPVLSVTDAGLGPVRGIVHFAVKDGRVRFHIDDMLAAQGNLSINARLLSLALTVRTRAKLSLLAMAAVARRAAT